MNDEYTTWLENRINALTVAFENCRRAEQVDGATIFSTKLIELENALKKYKSIHLKNGTFRK